MLYGRIIYFCSFIFLISCSSNGNDKIGPAPYSQTGKASYYASILHGEPTASGEVHNIDSLSAAHRNLPFGTIVKVTNRKNGKSVNVKINDRGPYEKSRIIDLSRAAAVKIDMIEDGVAEIKLKVIKAAPGYSISDSTTLK